MRVELTARCSISRAHRERFAERMRQLLNVEMVAVDSAEEAIRAWDSHDHPEGHQRLSARERREGVSHHPSRCFRESHSVPRSDGLERLPVTGCKPHGDALPFRVLRWPSRPSHGTTL